MNTYPNIPADVPRTDRLIGQLSGRLEMSRRRCRHRRLMIACMLVIIAIFYILHTHVPAVVTEINLTPRLSSNVNKASVNRLSHKIIRVVSQNIYLPQTPWLKNNYDVLNRLEAFANYVSPCDIAMVQEISIFRAGPWIRPGNFVELARLMKNRGFLYRASSMETIPKWFGQNSGLAVYSKHPVLESRNKVFKDVSWSETGNNKGFIIAKLLIRKRIVYVVNTHLDAGDSVVREKQMNELLKAVRFEINQTPGLIILAGDLNTEVGEAEINIIKEKMKIFELREVFDQHFDTCYEKKTLDHMFVSERLTIQDKSIRKFLTLSQEPISDHYALWAELEYT